MSDLEDRKSNKTKEHCIECPAGFEECLDCGACDHCDSDATLNENELPPNWLKFIEKSKQQSS